MALEIFKCACGQEFEDSEFCVSKECEICRMSRILTPIHTQTMPDWTQTMSDLFSNYTQG